MKLRSGKELSQLEIMKRLNTMGIKYNSDIIGKNYYINLYNDAIQSIPNLIKIKHELEKDKMYSDFYNQKLRKINECSLRFVNGTNIVNNENNVNNMNNNDKKNRKNNGIKKFNCGYDTSLIYNLAITQLAYNFIDYNSKYIDIIGNKINNCLPKILLPIQAIKKYTMVNISPDMLRIINELIDILNKLMGEKYLVIAIIIFLLLVIIIFLLFRKRMRNKKK